MFNDHDKALILKVHGIQIKGRNGGLVPVGAVYIKRVLQYFSTSDVATRTQINDRMTEELDQIGSLVAAGEIRELNTLLRDKCEATSPQKVRGAITALVRKAAKRGGNTVAV